MELDTLTIVLLFFFGFIGAFLNAVVGGGGPITLPTLMFVGLPPATAIATNKLAATMGNFTSMFTFLRTGKIDLKRLAPYIPLVFIAAMSGAYIVLFYLPNY